MVSERAITLLEARLRGRDRLQSERMQRFLALVHSQDETEEGRDLLAMLIDDFYVETFHAPHVPPASETPFPARRQPAPGGGHKSERRPRRPHDRKR